LNIQDYGLIEPVLIWSGLKSTVLAPDVEKVQSDGRIRKWKKIEEADNRYLRVVLLEDGITIHNAFFDRRFKE